MRDRDIVDSKERELRKKERERERSRKNCRNVLVRIPTYSIGLDWIRFDWLGFGFGFDSVTDIR